MQWNEKKNERKATATENMLFISHADLHESHVVRAPAFNLWQKIYLVAHSQLFVFLSFAHSIARSFLVHRLHGCGFFPSLAWCSNTVWVRDTTANNNEKKKSGTKLQCRDIGKQHSIHYHLSSASLWWFIGIVIVKKEMLTHVFWSEKPNTDAFCTGILFL